MSKFPIAMGAATPLHHGAHIPTPANRVEENARSSLRQKKAPGRPGTEATSLRRGGFAAASENELSTKFARIKIPARGNTLTGTCEDFRNVSTDMNILSWRLTASMRAYVVHRNLLAERKIPTNVCNLAREIVGPRESSAAIAFDKNLNTSRHLAAIGRRYLVHPDLLVEVLA
jgi:hypothetical protein